MSEAKVGSAPVGTGLAAPWLASAVNRRAVGEFAALLASFGVWTVAEATGYKVAAFTAMFPAWAFYFALRVWRNPDLVRDWGFRLDNLRRLAPVYAGLTAMVVAGMALFALLRGKHGVSASMFLVLALYPPWAIAQQFLLQNMIVRNAREIGMPPMLLPLLAGLAFAVAHVPDWPLVALTGAAGIGLTLVYRGAPNLWLLAVMHAVIGTAAFTLVLARDPLGEFPGLRQLAAALPELHWGG